MLNIIISGTIGGIYEYPNEMFSDYCYEGWGNCWSLIDGIKAKYIPAKKLKEQPTLLEEIDILMAELGQRKLHKLAHEHDIFNIATESGAGFEIDRHSIEAKMDFIELLDNCSLILSTTHGGQAYLSMFTNTPVLDIPLPMDMYKFRPRSIDKYNKFTICIGEIIESCLDDRPLQFTALAVARGLNIPIVSTIGPQTNLNSSDLETLGFNPNIYPHMGLYEMSADYLAKSHISMMLGQRPTFGRFIYVSWAIGVPCIASRYQVQEQICPELTFGYEEIDKIAEAVLRLKDNKKYYKEVRRRGLLNISKILSMDKIALRIVNEILPYYRSE